MKRTVVLALLVGFVMGAAGVIVTSRWLPEADTPRPIELATEDPQERSAGHFDPNAERYRCTIEGVIDGDTIQCFEGATRVRLLLIDSPESGQGKYYFASRDFLADLLPIGTSVTLEADADFRDSYGRVLAYVWLPDGRMANEELVRAGLSQAYAYNGRNVRHWDRIVKAQHVAQRAAAGFWAHGPILCAPEDFRHRRCSGFY